MSLSGPHSEVKSDLNGHNGYEHTSSFKIRDDAGGYRWFSDPGANPNGHTEAAGEDSPRSSWYPMDMATAMAGGEILPDLGRRDDGALLLYMAKVHWFFGSFESGKTWAALYFVAQILKDGGNALYIDFEDDARGIGWRLYQLGVPLNVIHDCNRFVYVRPDEALKSQAALADFESLLLRPFPIAVIDGVTESISMESLKDGVGGDIAAWQKLLPKRVARQTGAATICIDHIPKAQDNRAMPIGSQHKLSGLDGVAYKFICVVKIGKTKVGWSDIRVIKDRPGGVRGPLGIDHDPSDHSDLVGHFVLDATDSIACKQYIAVADAGFSLAGVDSADAQGSKTRPQGSKPKEPQRASWCMEKISEYLENELDDTQRSQNQIVTHMNQHVKGRSGKPVAEPVWRGALKLLKDEGFVFTCRGARNSFVYFTFERFDSTKVYVPEDIERRSTLAKKTMAEKEYERAGGESDD